MMRAFGGALGPNSRPFRFCLEAKEWILGASERTLGTQAREGNFTDYALLLRIMINIYIIYIYYIPHSRCIVGKETERRQTKTVTIETKNAIYTLQKVFHKKKI